MEDRFSSSGTVLAGGTNTGTKKKTTAENSHHMHSSVVQTNTRGHVVLGHLKHIRLVCLTDRR